MRLRRPNLTLTRRWRGAAPQIWPCASRRAVASTPNTCARISRKVRLVCAWLYTWRLPNATSPCRDAHSVAMSARDLSRMVALSCKTLELQAKSHFARAMEKGAAAIAAAQELGQEDCLVVTRLQQWRIDCLHGYATTPGVAAEAKAAAKEQESQMLLAAFATLERRRAAGTLLPGKCSRWPEEEWYGHFLQHRQVMNKQRALTPKELADLVQFVGYDTYLTAATAATYGICFKLRTGSFDSSDVLPFSHFIRGAINLFEQPRRTIRGVSSLASEDVLCSALQVLSKVYGPVIEACGPQLLLAPIAELLARWDRCARSGILRQRDMVAGTAAFWSIASARKEENAASLAAATLRCCSLRSCGARELHPGHYKQCGACKTVAYCCREHQLEDWPAHKAACKAARKAAAEEAGGAA